MARDWSHGKVRAESIKDYGSVRLRINGALIRMTGMGVDAFGFTESDIRGVMQFSTQDAAELLLAGTDYVSDKRNHG